MCAHAHTCNRGKINLKAQKIRRIFCRIGLSKKREAFVDCSTAGNSDHPLLLLIPTQDSGVLTLKAVGTGKHGIVREREVTLLRNCTVYSRTLWKNLLHLHIKGLTFTNWR